MSDNNEKLKVQEAPEKNSDKAFVQVGSDGKPQLPDEKTTAQPTGAEQPKEGTLADR